MRTLQKDDDPERYDNCSEYDSLYDVINKANELSGGEYPSFKFMVKEEKAPLSGEYSFSNDTMTMSFSVKVGFCLHEGL